MARKIADHTWKMSLPKYVSRKEFSTRLKRWAHNSRDTSASKNCAKVSTFSMYGNFSESGKWTIKPFHLYVPTLFCARFFSSLSEKKLSLQIFLNIFNENRSGGHTRWKLFIRSLMVFANFHNLFQFMLMVSSGRLGSANVFRFFLLSTPRHVIWQIFYEHFQKFS